MKTSLLSTLFLSAFTLVSAHVSAAQSVSDQAVQAELSQVNARLSQINQILENTEPRMTPEQLKSAGLCMFEGKFYSSGAALSSGGMTQICTPNGTANPVWKLQNANSGS